MLLAFLTQKLISARQDQYKSLFSLKMTYISVLILAVLLLNFWGPITRNDHLGVRWSFNSIHPFLLNPPSQSTLSYSIHHLNPPLYFKLLNPLIRPQLNPPNSIHPFLLNPASQSTLSCSIHHLNPYLNLTPKWSFLLIELLNPRKKAIRTRSY